MKKFRLVSASLKGRRGVEAERVARVRWRLTALIVDSMYDEVVSGKHEEDLKKGESQSAEEDTGCGTGEPVIPPLSSA